MYKSFVDCMGTWTYLNLPSCQVSFNYDCPNSSGMIALASDSTVTCSKVSQNDQHSVQYMPPPPDDLADSLTQVISMYVDTTRPVPQASSIVQESSNTPSECMFSTQVPYSEDSTASPVSPSGNSVSSLNTASAGSAAPFSLPSEVDSHDAPANDVCSPPSSNVDMTSPNRNSDSLKSSLYSNGQIGKQYLYHGDLSWDSKVLEPSDPRGALENQSDDLGGQYAETWRNLFDFPAGWQILSDCSGLAENEGIQFHGVKPQHSDGFVHPSHTEGAYDLQSRKVEAMGLFPASCEIYKSEKFAISRLSDDELFFGKDFYMTESFPAGINYPLYDGQLFSDIMEESRIYA